MKENIIKAMLCAIITIYAINHSKAISLNKLYHSYSDSIVTIADSSITSNIQVSDALNKDSAKVESQKSVISFDAVKYSLDKRYHAHDEDFAKAWHDHLFMVVGAGGELMLAPSKDYRFSPLTTAHIGVGKQFNERHALRFVINGGFGTQENSGHLFARLGARIDHMFNVSSFFDGYHPARVLNVSTLLGAGYHYSRIKHHNSAKAFEGHAGLQFRFFTGPQGYINLEPYIGIAQDAYDLSEAQNWRKYDVFYGINASYVHYLHSNLSREKRNKYLNAYKVAKTYEKLAPKDTIILNDSLRKIFATEYDELKKSNIINDSLRNVLDKRYNATKGDTLLNDSLLKSWQTPFFLEISNGVSMLKSPNLDYVGTTGHNLKASLGKWFSPAIGLRMSLSSSNFTWKKEHTEASLSPVRPAYTNKMHSMMFGVGAEAMINPLGFVKNYNWDQKAGFHFLFGGELGWILKEQSGTNLSCHTESYTAAVQLWAKLYEGLHLFVEPRYASYNYRLPYSNVHKHKRFSDETFSLNLGISMQLRSHKYLDKDADDEKNFDESKISVGLGGGITLMSTKSHYRGDNTLRWNASAHGTYRFDHYSGARLGLEYLSLSDNIMSAYTDYNMSLPEIDYGKTSKTGLWKRTFHIGIISADYVLNLTNLFSNHKDRWSLEAFVGPSFAMILGESGEMYSGERRQPNHKYKVKDKVGFESYWGANGGMNLSYKLSNNISLYLSPTFYLFKEFDLPASMTRNFTLIETINAGVQYNF